MDIKITSLNGAVEKFKKFILKNKLIAFVLVAGIVLLMLPTKKDNEKITTESDTVTAPDFSLSQEEKRIAKALANIDGAGRVSVVLTLKSGVLQELAENERGTYRSDEQSKDTDLESTIITISQGSGVQTTVPIRYYYPEYQGALIICDGGSDCAVKLKVTEAVSSLTGLGTDKITVVKMKNQEVKK